MPFGGTFFNLPNFLKSISTLDTQILRLFPQQQLFLKVERKNSPPLKYSFINSLYTIFFFQSWKPPGLLIVSPHIKLHTNIATLLFLVLFFMLPKKGQPETYMSCTYVDFYNSIMVVLILLVYFFPKILSFYLPVNNIWADIFGESFPMTQTISWPVQKAITNGASLAAFYVCNTWHFSTLISKLAI